MLEQCGNAGARGSVFQRREAARKGGERDGEDQEDDALRDARDVGTQRGGGGRARERDSRGGVAVASYGSADDVWGRGGAAARSIFERCSRRRLATSAAARR